MAQPLVDRKSSICYKHKEFSALKLFIAPNGYDNWANIKVVYFLLLKTLVASPIQNCDLDTYIQDKKLNF